MALLLALGLSVLAAAVLPRTARPGLLVAAAPIETAVVLGTVTGDGVLTLAGAVTAAILALLLYELVRALVLPLAPGQERTRALALERRTVQRTLAAEERARRQEQRRHRRLRDDEGIAA